MGKCVILEHLGAAEYRVEIRSAGESQLVAMARELAAAGELLERYRGELGKMANALRDATMSEDETAQRLNAEVQEWLDALASGKDPDPPIDPTNDDPTGSAPGSWPAELLAAHNAIRSANGLGSLSANGNLAAAAQAHANDISRTGNLSHTGSGGTAPEDRIVAAGYPFGPPGSAVGENLAGGQPEVSQAMDGIHLEMVQVLETCLESVMISVYVSHEIDAHTKPPKAFQNQGDGYLPSQPEREISASRRKSR